MGATHSTRKITLIDDEKAGVIKMSESLAYRLRGQLEGQQSATVAAAAAAAARPPAPVQPSPTPPASPPPIAAVPSAPEPPQVPQLVPEEPVPPQVPAAESVPEPQKEETAPSLPAVVLDIQEELLPPPAASAVTQVDSEPAASHVGVAVRAAPSPSLAQPSGTIPPWSIYAEEAHLMVMRLREEKEQELKALNHTWQDRMEAREQQFSQMSGLREEEAQAALEEVERLFVKASCSPVCQDQQQAVMGCYQDHPHQSLRCARQVENFARCVDLSRLQSVMKQRAN